jgi:hypothetical protein
LILIVLGLTGPFSTVITPVLILRALLMRDFKHNLWTYIPVFACALIQTYFLLKSNRFHEPFIKYWFDAIGGEVPPSVPELTSGQLWTVCLQMFVLVWLFFPKFSILSVVGAAGYWLVTLYPLTKNYQKSGLLRANSIYVILLAVAACGFTAAGIYSVKEAPFVLDFSTGNRYTWIPFTLFFLIGALTTQGNRRLQTWVFLFAMMICVDRWFDNPNEHAQYKQADMQYPSFVNFSHYRDMIIPIQPAFRAFPGTSISVHQDRAELVRKNIEAIDIPIHDRREHKPGIASNGDGTFTIECGSASDIGLEIQMDRRLDSWVKLEWWDPLNAADNNYLWRYYPTGKVEAVFALRNKPGGVTIHFIPRLIPFIPVTINRMTAYCLP